MVRFPKWCAALLMMLAGGTAFAANSEIGAIVMHGKWGSPDSVAGLTRALESEGYLVSAPLMPWSRRRAYDAGADGADTETDANIARLRERGAKQIVVIGHSLGANYALHYAQRAPILLTAVIAIAPGHRPEGTFYAPQFADDVKKAQALVNAGKSDEAVWFMDFNTGNRRERMRATAATFLSYFDPEGQFNLARNAKQMKPAIPVLWIVPQGEELRLRGGVVALYQALPASPGKTMAEPDSDHLGAPTAAARVIIEWIRQIAAKN